MHPGPPMKCTQIICTGGRTHCQAVVIPDGLRPLFGGLPGQAAPNSRCASRLICTGRATAQAACASGRSSQRLGWCASDLTCSGHARACAAKRPCSSKGTQGCPGLADAHQTASAAVWPPAPVPTSSRRLRPPPYPPPGAVANRVWEGPRMFDEIYAYTYIDCGRIPESPAQGRPQHPPAVAGARGVWQALHDIFICSRTWSVGWFQKHASGAGNR